MQRIIPLRVDTDVDIIVGKNIDDASALPAVARIAITVAGISCMDVAFIISSSIIFALATVCSSAAILFIAFIPAGVATPPIPSILPARFTDIQL